METVCCLVNFVPPVDMNSVSGMYIIGKCKKKYNLHSLKISDGFYTSEGVGATCIFKF